MEDDLRWAGRLDPVDHGDVGTEQRSGGRVQVVVDGGQDILGGERLAVMEGDVVAQREGPPVARLVRLPGESQIGLEGDVGGGADETGEDMLQNGKSLPWWCRAPGRTRRPNRPPRRARSRRAQDCPPARREGRRPSGSVRLRATRRSRMWLRPSRAARLRASRLVQPAARHVTEKTLHGGWVVLQGHSCLLLPSASMAQAWCTRWLKRGVAQVVPPG